jgi:hypothetical protein
MRLGLSADERYDLSMLFRSRHRFVVALIVVGSLLFQQVAVAAYACDPAARSQAPAPTHHCEHAQKAPAPNASSPLCEKHCTPDLTVLTDTAALGVPALALPPVVFTLVVHEPAAPLTFGDTVSLTRSDPPPRLRYCSLLI